MAVVDAIVSQLESNLHVCALRDQFVSLIVNATVDLSSTVRHGSTRDALVVHRLNHVTVLDALRALARAIDRALVAVGHCRERRRRWRGRRGRGRGRRGGEADTIGANIDDRQVGEQPHP
eukprot:scaffold70433_cov27-Tisochrysis_lutea.AAC.3